MRSLILAAAASLAAGGAGAAQPAPPTGAPAGPPPTPPRLFLDAGYTQPDITQGFCHNVDTSTTQCTIPAMTAGRYMVMVRGTSTATAADAAQQIIIQVGGETCYSTRGQDAQHRWAVGSKRTFDFACMFTVITDTPLPVTAHYVDAKATKDPGGPLLGLRRESWSGVMNVSPLSVAQQP